MHNAENRLNCGGKFSNYLVTELKNPSIYISSALIGGAINLFSGTVHFAPFYVPLLVQSITRAVLHHKNRYNDMLAQLSVKRSDPGFVVTPKCEIVLSAGGDDLLDDGQVKNLEQVLGKEIAQEVADCATGEKAVIASALTNNRWYEVRCKPLGRENGDCNLLVWFIDITDRRMNDRLLASFLDYSTLLLADLKDVVKKRDLQVRLARFFLNNGFGAVFMTRPNDDGDPEGRVFVIRPDGEMEGSDEIVIKRDSDAPLLSSRKKRGVVYGDAGKFESRKEFEAKYPFDKRVSDFIKTPIKDFVNYHENDFSIILFNRRRKAIASEERVVSALVNLSHTIIRLVDIARENDEQFIQKVMGLCAASEFSDELTGQHIMRVNEYSRHLACLLGMSEDFVDIIGKVAALHDIGKVAISELIKLPRAYTDEERQRMQMHTVIGAKIIETMSSFSSRTDTRLEMARNIALHHHQTYKGDGYPGLATDDHTITNLQNDDYKYYAALAPLKGTEIPIEGLIVGLADRYDALRSRRQYKPEFTHAKTVEIMTKDDRTGTTGIEWYGVDLWECFMEGSEQFDKIFKKLQ